MIDLAKSTRSEDYERFHDEEEGRRYRRLISSRRIYQDPRLEEVRDLYRRFVRVGTTDPESEEAEVARRGVEKLDSMTRAPRP